jgi:2-methylisocitrate lyase-like PEP mutase family enzyme
MTVRPDAATLFHRLHQGPEILLLPNAWDAGSARLIESLGAKAIATTSAGVCWALGYQDGTMVPPAALRAAVAAIARVISVPLSVDIEGGYAADAAAVGESVAGVVEAGAVGINIEDGTGAPDLLCAKIAAAKQAASRLGVDLFVNARTDVYLRQLAPAEARVAETLARARRYAAAGADSIFVPGVTAADEIRALAAIDRPLAIMARPTLAPAAELAKLGVRRLSAGSSLAEQALARTAALAEGFLRDGRSDHVCDGAMPYPKANALFAAR